MDQDAKNLNSDQENKKQPMPRSFCLLGASGDIISFLPLLLKESQLGEKPTLMVAKKYAGVLNGVSYVKPLIYDGEAMDLEGAMIKLRAIDKSAICVQIAGPPEQVKKWTYYKSVQKADSFEKEMWLLAGRLEWFKEQPPLIFDKRDAEREAKLIPKSWLKAGRRKKRVLIHAGGKTSPFPYRELLFKLAELALPTWEILDLDTIKAEYIYDMLSLYENADLLIACDSAPLHLAKATPQLPVIALVKDKPNFWHGAAWRPQYIRFIRYSDFPKRCVDMLERLKYPLQDPPAGEEPRIIHAWSEYEMLDRPNDIARKSWQQEGVIDCCIESGACGRDSHSVTGDTLRFPFVRDVLRLACMKARPDDIICLTRCRTIFSEGLSRIILKNPLCYAHRTVDLDGQPTFHPSVDLFCFTKRWWQEHQTEMPDMILGTDSHWHRVLFNVLKKHGAVELPFVIKNMEVEKE